MKTNFIKSENFKNKIKLANLIKKNWLKIDENLGEYRGYYWSGIFLCPKRNIKIRIYFQNYVTGFRKFTPNYVKIRFYEEKRGITNALSVKEIKTILKDFDNQTKTS